MCVKPSAYGFLMLLRDIYIDQYTQWPSWFGDRSLGKKEILYLQWREERFFSSCKVMPFPSPLGRTRIIRNADWKIGQQASKADTLYRRPLAARTFCCLAPASNAEQNKLHQKRERRGKCANGKRRGSFS